MKRNASKKPAAEICLYGTRQTGAGYIAALSDGRMFGNGEPKSERTFTDAILLGLDAIDAAGVKSGIVRVVDAGGERQADFKIGSGFYYGGLPWQPARVFTTSAAEIKAAAKADAAASGSTCTWLDTRAHRCGEPAVAVHLGQPLCAGHKREV